MKNIIWSKIKQGNYAIEEDGRVFSYYRNDYMKTKIDKDGYETICLVTSEGKRSSFGIHRLLMVTYFPCENMDELQVNHINGDKTNNSFDNLEWVTGAENLSHAHILKLRDCVGEHHHKAKLTEEQAKHIIQLLKENKTFNQIKEIYPWTTTNMLSKIKCGRTWKHIPR